MIRKRKRLRATLAAMAAVAAGVALYMSPVAASNNGANDIAANTLERVAGGVVLNREKLDVPREQAVAGIVVTAEELADGQYGVVYSAKKGFGNNMPLVSVIATASGVQLSWEPVEQVRYYEVSRDGKHLGRTDGRTWTDSDVDAGGKHDYTVKAVTSEKVSTVRPTAGKSAPETDTMLTPEGPVKVEEPSSAANSESRQTSQTLRSDSDETLEKKAPEEDRAANKVVTMIAPVSIPETDTREGAEATVADRVRQDFYETVFNFQSFIANKTVKGFPCVFDGAHFGGDDRGFADPLTTPAGNRYRLNQQVQYLFPTDGGTPVIMQAKDVGVTTKYNDDGSVEQRQASDEWMNVRVIEKGPGYGHVSMYHAGTNPYCDLGGPDFQGIKVQLIVKAATPPLGQVSFNGAGRPVPHQQADWFTDVEDPQSWHRSWDAENVSFNCLVQGVCEWRDIVG